MISMKRFLLLAALILSMAFLSAHPQSLYDADSYEYFITDVLAAEAGIVGPPRITPVTGRDLMLVLKNISYDSLSASARSLYDELLVLLEYDKYAYLGGNITIAPEFYLYSDYSGEKLGSDRNSFFLRYKDSNPFLQGSIETGLGPNVFLEAAIDLRQNPKATGMNYTNADFLYGIFSGNPELMLFGYIPTFGRGAFGNDYINLTLGRTPHQAGPGYTGSLLIGDNFLYQELVLLTMGIREFRYSISYTSFDISSDSPTQFIGPGFSGKQQRRLIHNMAAGNNDFRISISVGAMMYLDSAFDPRMFNPFMLIHEYFNFGEGVVVSDYDEVNNIMGLDFEVPIGRNWRISGELVIDQFQLPWEDWDKFPLSFGALLNTSWHGVKDEHILRVYGEIIYANPYLYVNTKYDDEGLTTPNYNYDWLTGYQRRYSYQAEETAWSGYYYGPNTLSFGIGADYRNRKLRMNIAGVLMYRIHGDTSMDDPTLPAPPWNALGLTGTLEHTVEANCYLDWEVIRSLHILSGVSLSAVVNYQNEEGRVEVIPGMMLGLKYSIF